MLSPEILSLVVSGVLLGALYIVVSIGLSLIFGVMRVMNFAHGEVIMLSMYGAYWAHEAGGVDPYLAGLVVVPVVFLLCMTVLRPFVLWLVGSPPLVQVFATLGLSVALQNLALVLWGGNYRSVQMPYSGTLLHVGALQIPLTRFVVFVVALAVVTGLHLFLKHSYFGKAVRATAQNRRTALLMGIDADRIYVLVFALGVSIAALSGVLLMPIYTVYPGSGFQFAMIAFVVVVLGGLGSLPGVVLGGLLIGLVEVFSGYFIAPSMTQIVYFAVFILVLILRPAGLLGQRGAEELGLK
ncbi:MAG: branched-chain amino acid ABC transporter permease [Rhodopila sp.]|nr:branched-chain amino acid ABC transporter permease [Rhodopila sp.]